jgi:hypothetical protein
MELPSACGYATESCEYVDQWDRTNLAVEDLPADAKKLSMSGISEAGPGGPRYGGVGQGRGRGQGRVAMGVYLKTVAFWSKTAPPWNWAAATATLFKKGSAFQLRHFGRAV